MGPHVPQERPTTCRNLRQMDVCPQSVLAPQKGLTESDVGQLQRGGPQGLPGISPDVGPQQIPAPDIHVCCRKIEKALCSTPGNPSLIRMPRLRILTPMDVLECLFLGTQFVMYTG